MENEIKITSLELITLLQSLKDTIHDMRSSVEEKSGFIHPAEYYESLHSKLDTWFDTSTSAVFVLSELISE